jgi:glucose-6-phosphate isomerase
MPGGFRRKRAREQQRVRVDVNGLMRGVVGEAGLSDEDLAAFAPRFDAMASGVERRRRLGSSSLPAAKAEVKRTTRLADEVRGAFDDLIVLTNRDLATGVRALVETAREPATPDRPALRVHVVHGLDPEHFTSLLGRLDLGRSLFNVVGAAGDALDTMSQFLIVRDRLLKELGAVAYKQHVVITTAVEEGALRQIVNDEGFRDLPFRMDVEDAFAVLSAAALFPAACAGADPVAVVAGAGDMAERCQAAEVAANPARLLAIALRHACSCTVAAAPVGAQPLAAWIERASAAADVRASALPLVLFFQMEHRPATLDVPKTFQDLDSIGYLGGQELGTLADLARQAEEVALWNAGRPTATLVCPQLDDYVLGQVMYLVQSAVVLARGLTADEPPLPAPTSTAARFAYGLAGRPGYESERAEAQRLVARKEPRYVV